MIRKIIFAFLTVSLIVACSSSSKKEGSMIVEGNIHGFKKGTLYLQKFQDTVLVSVDSIFLNGENNFRLADNIESPEIYFLTLNQLESEKIDFFGEKGTITINTKLDKFGTAAEISGSESHEKLKEYRKMMSQFNGRRLEIIGENFEAQKNKDGDKIVALDQELDRLLKNKYRYTASFALRNNNSEVAPYLALAELFDAHITLLDTVNNSLTPAIQKSKYGVALSTYIKDIKSNTEE